MTKSKGEDMFRKTVAMLITVCLVLAVTSEARSKYEIGVFAGLRFGGSFIDGGYTNNPILEHLDIAPGT